MTSAQSLHGRRRSWNAGEISRLLPPKRSSPVVMQILSPFATPTPAMISALATRPQMCGVARAMQQPSLLTATAHLVTGLLRALVHNTPRTPNSAHSGPCAPPRLPAPAVAAAASHPAGSSCTEGIARCRLCRAGPFWCAVRSEPATAADQSPFPAPSHHGRGFDTARTALWHARDRHPCQSKRRAHHCSQPLAPAAPPARHPLLACRSWTTASPPVSPPRPPAVRCATPAHPAWCWRRLLPAPPLCGACRRQVWRTRSWRWRSRPLSGPSARRVQGRRAGGACGKGRGSSDSEGLGLS
jgi:hypothetical protein